jgi:hypothetical protein
MRQPGDSVMTHLARAAAAAVLLLALGAAPGWAASACPSGYRWQSAQGNCISIVAPVCPRGTTANAGRTQCSDPRTHAMRDPTCPSGYQYRVEGGRGQCVRERAASCPAGQRVEPRNGNCVAGRP